MDRLWLDLDRAMHGPDLEILRAKPWESSKPEVQKAWRTITDPGNLDALTARMAGASAMNPTARYATEMALKECRRRLSEGR